MKRAALVAIVFAIVGFQAPAEAQVFRCKVVVHDVSEHGRVRTGEINFHKRGSICILRKYDLIVEAHRSWHGGRSYTGVARLDPTRFPPVGIKWCKGGESGWSTEASRLDGTLLSCRRRS